jgi:hypothetical protein
VQKEMEERLERNGVKRTERKSTEGEAGYLEL